MALRSIAKVAPGGESMSRGFRVDGGGVTSPGEHRGGVIVGGSSRPVAAGDFFVIPAGVPHQYVLARGDSIRYLTVKVLK